LNNVVKGGNFLKEVELKLVCELMKNSRRSDRELAKVLGVSQPTVSRTLKKLEKEGVIKEYTMIPDFTRLGFQIMSIDFAKLKEPISEEKLKEIRKQVRQTLLKEPKSAIVGMRGWVAMLTESLLPFTKTIQRIRSTSTM
jgi:DNA-binding Lrp family transcriptional regulator